MPILIVGLGNVGKKYDNTRHNTGFVVVDAIAKELETKFSDKKDLHANVAEVNLDGEKLILAKPTTFMNKSGDALLAIINAYKINKKDVWVVFDDASMTLGTLRVRHEGSAGGHNGIKSIIETLDSQTFWRFKVGVDMAPENIPLEDWVLSKFPKEQSDLLQRSIELTKETILNALQTEPEEESETLI
ncbi:aminoacyl-tRNA hydrolase [Patescibacteria group bacterium]|nr:aminoacyl-tRNA hydrolase [Patescibacteria group bacterium]MBU4453068.1 aminoacyl-tRNA hydrolase [Patescibacteria group bacterium]MCG2687847.1 aminoacyl-tRNA hydrolase [Candidatus Parcubacteria bacterium]